MKVTLTRRWGPHRADKSVEVSDSQGKWLVQHGYAESTGELKAPTQKAAAEGANGADPVAGGDATRRRMQVSKPERDADRNYARQAEGSSPTYRAGFDADAAERQGEAGRDFDPKQDHGRRTSAVEGSPAADQEAARDASPASGEPSPASGSRSADSGSERPARRTRKTSSDRA
jgi:hypothetical protein